MKNSTAVCSSDKIHQLFPSEFLRNSTAVCYSGKIPTGKVEKLVNTMDKMKYHFIWYSSDSTIRNFARAAESFSAQKSMFSSVTNNYSLKKIVINLFFIFQARGKNPRKAKASRNSGRGSRRQSRSKKAKNRPSKSASRSG